MRKKKEEKNLSDWPLTIGEKFVKFALGKREKLANQNYNSFATSVKDEVKFTLTPRRRLAVRGRKTEVVTRPAWCAFRHQKHTTE